MMKLKSLIFGAFVAALCAGQVFAQGVAQLGSGQMWANPTGSQARGQPVSASSYFDFVFGSTANGFPARISGSWTEALFGSSFAFSSNTLNLQPSGASTLGGVNSLTCASHQWFNALSTAGAFTCAQPALADLPTGSQDTVLGYWTSTVISATAVPNCTGAITYSTGTHTFGCNASAGTGNVVSSGTPTANQLGLWVNATTLAGVTATAHAIVVGEGSSAPNFVGPGTLGQFDAAQGASADPAFVSGPWTLLATLTGGGASYSDTTHITASYNEYEIRFENIIPVTAAQPFTLQVHSGGAFQNTSYANTFSNNVAGTITGSTSSTGIVIGTSNQNNAGPGINGYCTFHLPSQTSVPKVILCSVSGNNNTPATYNLYSTGYWNGGNGAVDGFQVSFASGNITSGNVKIYGRL